MYKIIIVDDEPLIRKGIETILPWDELEVSEVFSAESGKEALAIMEEASVDLMITDICMGDMDGLSLIRQVNGKYPHMRVIVLTGYSSFEYAQECCRMDVDEFLLKPIDEKQLVKTIAKELQELAEERKQTERSKILKRAIGVREQVYLDQAMQNIVEKRFTGEEIDAWVKENEQNPGSFIQVMIIQPLIIDQTEWEKKHLFQQLQVKSLCIQLFDARKKGITFEDELGRTVVAVYTENELEESSDIIMEFKKTLNTEYDLPVNLLLGSVVHGMKEAYISYNDAQALIETAKKRKNEVIVEFKQEKRLRLFLETFEQLLKIAETNIDDYETVAKVNRTFFSSMDSYNASPALKRKLIFQFVSRIYYAYALQSKEMPSNMLESCLKIIQNTELEELKEIVTDFIEKLEKQNALKDMDVISRAKEIINERFSQDISVTSLSEQFYMTTSHFSRLFKQQVGEGCNEYIVGKRMEKAMYLLESTNMTSGKIASLVGYKDVNYFSMAFKRRAGLSPKEYRNLKRQDYNQKKNK